MAITLIIFSCLLWLCSLAALFNRPLYAPAFSYLGLLCISFATRGGYQVVPVNGVMLISWLCMTVVVMLATLLQAPVVNRQSRGVAYMLGGALAGLAVGLLGYTVTPNLSLRYGIMIVAVVAGIFFGYLLYGNTPEGGKLRSTGSGYFRYLAAKGFPTAVTVMMPGMVLVILIALTTVSGL